MRRVRKVRCPQCGAMNYPTDPVCLSCGADLTPPPPVPVPTPVAPGGAPPGTSGTPGTPDDELRYGAIGAVVAVVVDVVLCVLIYASGDRSGFPGAGKIAGSLVSSALAGAVVGVIIARLRSKRGRASTTGHFYFFSDGAGRDVRTWAPFVLWLLLMVWLAVASHERALKGGNEFNIISVVLLVLIAIGAYFFLNVLQFLFDVRWLLGDISAADSWNQIVAMLAIALVLELLMFLAWPSNAPLNLVAVLLTAGVMVYYVVMRGIFND